MDNLKILSNSLFSDKAIVTVMLPALGYMYVTEQIGNDKS
jgi:hypothetical protein